jgi:hypothetical protein
VLRLFGASEVALYLGVSEGLETAFLGSILILLLILSRPITALGFIPKVPITY